MKSGGRRIFRRLPQGIILLALLLAFLPALSPSGWAHPTVSAERPWPARNTAARQAGPDVGVSALSWQQVQKLIAGDGLTSDWLGYSVALDGDTAVVGANGAAAQQGAAYIFQRDQGGADNWGQVAQLTAGDGAASDWFGYSVAISGDIVVVGAIHSSVGANAQQGSAYVYGRNQGGADNWGLITKLVAGDGAANDWFGCAVSVDADTAVIGAYGVDIDSKAEQGAAYVFGRNQGGADQWGQVMKLITNDGAAQDWFGYSVAVDGDTIIAGSPYDQIGSETAQGSAYIF